MSLPGHKVKPVVWLVVYWVSQCALAAGLIVASQPPWGTTRVLDGNGFPPEAIPFVFLQCWLIMLVLWPGAFFALGRPTWWRRALVALGMVLSLHAVTRLMGEEGQTPQESGDLAFLVGLPAASAAAIWWFMARLGGWHMVREEEYVPPPEAIPLSLRDLFLTVTLAAFCIAPLHDLFVSWQNESKIQPQNAPRIIAVNAALTLVPLATLAAACIVRVAIGESASSWVIHSCLALLFFVWLGIVVSMLGTVLSLLNQQDRYARAAAIGVAVFVSGSLGAVGHACWLGYFLRRLGYRIQSLPRWASR